MHLGHGRSGVRQPGPRPIPPAGGTRGPPSGPAALLADGVRPEDAKGIPVISADDRFNLFSSHANLIIKYGRFLRGNAQSELHLHSGGFGGAETLHELDPSTPLEELRALYRYADFEDFAQAFGAVGKRLRTPEDYALVVRRLLERLEAENVRYAEITLAAGVALWKGQEFGPIFDAIREAAGGSAVEVRWILDAVRQFSVEQAQQVAEMAAERMDRGVVAFGLGGSEERGPAERFTDVFAFARRAGLRLVAHAGESTGPESVWAAAETGRGAHWPRHRGGARRGINAASARAGHPARDLPTQQPHHRRGEEPRRAPVTAAVRCGRADHIEHGRPGHVRLHADGEYQLAARQFRLQRRRDARNCGERVPVRVPVNSPG